MNRSRTFIHLITDVIILLSAICLWTPATCRAESSGKTMQEQIDIGRQIWDMEKLAEKGDADAIDQLENYLDSPYLPVARIAARQLVRIGTSAANAALNAHDGEASNVSIRVGLAKFSASGKQEAINNLLDLLNDPDITPGQRASLKDEIATLFSTEGWHEELELHFKDNPQTTYSEIRSKIRNLSFSEKKQFLENTLKNFNTAFEYEAAIRLLEEEIQNDEIPFILDMLNDPDNIPHSSPPPFERIHTKYYILTTVIKSIPDQRSIPLLTELSLNSNEYVSKKASEALLWVKSNIPFPIKYQRLLLQSDEG